jgi:hypothetical protein
MGDLKIRDAVHALLGYYAAVNQAGRSACVLDGARIAWYYTAVEE